MEQDLPSKCQVAPVPSNLAQVSFHLEAAAQQASKPCQVKAQVSSRALDQVEQTMVRQGLLSSKQVSLEVNSQ